MNAESNQPQDIEVEYRFAGYYENETPPTLDELQDPKYLNNVIVHFEANPELQVESGNKIRD